MPLVTVTRRVVGTINVPGCEVRMGDDRQLTRPQLLEFIRGSSVVVTMYSDRVDREFLDAAGPQLKGVCNYAVGYENIDVELCQSRGVQVCNTPDAVTEGTANLAWGLILAVSRRIITADRYARSDEYPAKGQLGMADFLGVHLTGQRLLIVGAGRIGRAVAMRSLGFGMRVSYVARTRHADFEHAPLAADRIDLEAGLRAADVISIHTPMTAETRHLINAERLALLKPTAILINTARGPVIDELALVETLRAGRLWGAGLDVYEFEPRVSPGLRTLDNAVLTPHIGSAERSFRELMSEMVSENTLAILQGRKPPNLVLPRPQPA